MESDVIVEEADGNTAVTKDGETVKEVFVPAAEMQGKSSSIIYWVVFLILGLILMQLGNVPCDFWWCRGTIRYSPGVGPSSVNPPQDRLSSWILDPRKSEAGQVIKSQEQLSTPMVATQINNGTEPSKNICLSVFFLFLLAGAMFS
eukprot:TRINITY_DN64138_c0_g1_i1.p1 TRINITY_DN64138_c0_g1~~TRINITY_DN64138_c0_g1_i1.p1  ORF type:complete len:146 (-),score=25.08 TRINITY_DN64138_c0_g1_i1:145-582(-)